MVGEHQRAMINGLMPRYLALTIPARGSELTARVTALLLHFYVSDLPEGVLEIMIEDWCKALDGLPMWAINQGCDHWVTERGAKPKPAEIRQFAEAALAEISDEQAKLRAILERGAGGKESNLAERLRSSVDAVKIRAWAEPCRVTVKGDVVTIKAPSPFLRDGVERCLGPEIAAAYRGKSVVYAVAEGR
jgi:hypothetical protein